MNNIILNHLNTTIVNYPGNYLEIGSDDGALVASLARSFPDRTFVAVDYDNKSIEQIYKIIVDKPNVLFYNCSVVEFTNDLTDKIIDNLRIDTVFINFTKDYDDSAEAVKLAVKLLAGEPGQVIFSNLDNENIQQAIDEFKYLIEYRIIDQIELDSNTRVYKIREY